MGGGGVLQYGAVSRSMPQSWTHTGVEVQAADVPHILDGVAWAAVWMDEQHLTFCLETEKELMFT